MLRSIGKQLNNVNDVTGNFPLGSKPLMSTLRR